MLGSSIFFDDRLEFLGWQSLHSRCEFLSLAQFLLFINGSSGVKLDNYLFFAKNRTRFI